MEKLRLVILLTLCLYTVTVRAKIPDWVPAEAYELVAADKKRCMDEHKVEQALIDKANTDDIPPDDSGLKCYIYCIMDAFSVVDEDGNIEIETLAGFVPENLQEKTREGLTACENKGGDNPCDRLYNGIVCFVQKVQGVWYVL